MPIPSMVINVVLKQILEALLFNSGISECIKVTKCKSGLNSKFEPEYKIEIQKQQA